MKVAIASEHAGFGLKEKLKLHLKEKGVAISDLGTNSDQPVNYPPIAADLSERVVKGEFDLGILICGTGTGMAMASGKVPGARSALCTDQYMAKMAREHNNANILCLGAWIVGIRIAYEITDTFLGTNFTGGRHIRRIEMITELERNYSTNYGKRGILHEKNCDRL
jgi:ribose 5-phosphate isomerase B